MNIPLYVGNNIYLYDTITRWKTVWERVCEMAYEGDVAYSEIVTHPYKMRVEGIQNNNMDEKEHSNYYSKKSPKNYEEITLDDMWRKYSKRYADMGDPFVVPEFRRLHVPRALFESLGVYPWFRHSFPNCEITFWEQ